MKINWEIARNNVNFVVAIARIVVKWGLDMLKYKDDVMQRLKEAGYNTNVARKKQLLSQSTFQYIRDGKIIGTKALDQICSLLKCQPGDILEWVEDDG